MAGSGNGGALDFVFPKAGAAMSEIRKNNIANESASMDLAQRKSAQTAASQAFGGYDPQSGINWETGRQSDSNPMSAYASDPVMKLAGQLDPRGTLSSIMSMTMAPPKNVRVTGADGQSKETMMTPMAIRQGLAQGQNIQELGEGKAIDPNTAPTMLTAPGPNNRQQGYLWSPGMSQPQPFGAPGKLTQEPLSDIGKLGFDAGFMGGGTRPPGYSAGSGSTPPGPQAAATGPLPPVQSPLAGGSAPMPQSAPGGLPTMADIMRTKMTEMARTPEQQAALNKVAENAVEQSTPEYAQKQTAYQQKQAGEKMAAQNADSQFQRLINLATKIQGSPSLGNATGKFMGSKWVPDVLQGTVDVDTDIQALQQQVGLQGLIAAKQSSTTGASGFGALSEKELELLENSLASLNTRRGTPQFKDSLDTIINESKRLQTNLRASRPNDFQTQGSTGAWSITPVK